ncbi:acyl-CoA N-acyltransferase [Flammula alnicola]|nr:acyl-CoA N-acyltransferase [Flammula alnicola]
MSFINSYKAPDIATAAISFQDPYVINSSIPVPPLLETKRVQLIPFNPAIHGEPFYTPFAKDQAVLVKYLPGSWPTFDSFLWFLDFVRQDTGCVLFAIVDKTKPSDDARIAGRIAGAIGWLHGSPQNLSLEIGPVIILTEFQRTFVSTNAIGLLLKYVLDVPSQGGLGFRRVTWSANPFNVASIAAAEKMGFVKEGVMRWTWVLPVGKEGKPVSEKRGEGNGRDSAILSVCWDDWVSGVREVVIKRMERV